MREPFTKRAAASRARDGGNGGLVDEAAVIEHGEAAAGALGGEDGCGWEEMVWCPWCAKECEVQGSAPSRKGRSERERRRRRHQTIANAAHHSVTTTTDPINAEPTARASPFASFYCAPTRLRLQLNLHRLHHCAESSICPALLPAPASSHRPTASEPTSHRHHGRSQVLATEHDCIRACYSSVAKRKCTQTHVDDASREHEVRALGNRRTHRVEDDCRSHPYQLTTHHGNESRRRHYYVTLHSPCDVPVSPGHDLKT
jgi:hypothetical protein